MNIVNFQNEISLEINEIISTWLENNTLYTERLNLYNYPRWAIIRLCNNYETNNTLIKYIRSINNCCTDKNSVVNSLTKIYLLLMLKYADIDIKISVPFRKNVYKARLNNFLNKLHSSIKDVTHLIKTSENAY